MKNKICKSNSNEIPVWPRGGGGGGSGSAGAGDGGDTKEGDLFVRIKEHNVIFGGEKQASK